MKCDCFFFLCSAQWKTYFSPRDLMAISAEPRLIYPTHYTGMDNYVTDTENTTLYTKYASNMPTDKIYENIEEQDRAYIAKIYGDNVASCSKDACSGHDGGGGDSTNIEQKMAPAAEGPGGE